jgi:hypothetical protein
MYEMDIEDRIDLLEEARGYIEDAIALIKEALKGTDLYDAAERYIIASLEMCSYAKTRWAGKQPYNIDELIEELEAMKKEEEEEEA